jgi:hypothetical protein
MFCGPVSRALRRLHDSAALTKRIYPEFEHVTPRGVCVVMLVIAMLAMLLGIVELVYWQT